MLGSWEYSGYVTCVFKLLVYVYTFPTVNDFILFYMYCLSPDPAVTSTVDMPNSLAEYPTNVVIIAGTVASAVILVVLIGVLCVLTLYMCRVRRLQGVSAGQLICAFVHGYLIYQDFPSRNKTWTVVLSRLQMIMQVLLLYSAWHSF